MRVCVDIELDERTRKVLDLLGISPEELVQRLVDRYLYGDSGEEEDNEEEGEEPPQADSGELRSFCGAYPACSTYKGKLIIKLPRLVKLYKEGKASLDAVIRGLELMASRCGYSENEQGNILDAVKRSFIHTDVTVNGRTGMEYMLLVAMDGSDTVVYSVNDCHAWEIARGMTQDVVSQLVRLRELPGNKKKLFGGSTIDPLLDIVIADLRKRLNRVYRSRIAVSDGSEKVDMEKVKEERQLIRDALG